MIKVCHMTSVHAPEDVRIFKKECVSLAKAGYDTYLVEQGETYDKNGVHIIGVGTQENSRFARMFKMTKRVYEVALKVDADVYHIHDPELLPYGLKLKKKGKKVIFDSHENTSQLILEKKYIPRILRAGISKAYKRYEKRICNKLDAIIYVSPNVRKQFKVLNKRAVLIANYPLLADNAMPDFINRNIFFGGMIIPAWHHEDVIRAIEDIHDVSYTLCGAVSEGYLNQLSLLKGWSKVNYLGRISHERVYEELANSFIGLAIAEPAPNTNWNEGTLGVTKLFEEMMAGLPVICSNFELWKKVVEENNCGICVNPGKVEEIKNAIIKILNNKKLAKTMGENGRRLVEQKYNWSVEAAKLIELYKQLA